MDEPQVRGLLERLLHGLCEELSADRSIAALSGDGPFLVDFEVESQPVRLLCNPRLASAHATVACPLGPVPSDQAQAEAVLFQLLRVSQATATTGTTVGYEPLDRCLYLLHVVPLPTASARLLAATMAGLASMAARWREDHFLGTPSAPTGNAAHARPYA